MSKEELVSQLTALVEGYTDGLVSANYRLINSGYKLKEEKQEWAQKYHMVMADNKGLEEQNEGLRVEKQALLDVVSEWKSEVQSLSALNATLSGELQELKKDKEILLKTVQNWERNYTSIKHELDLAQKELAEDNAEKLRLHCLLQSRTEELETAEERHEDFKKKSHGILATLEENLQKKQEWERKYHIAMEDNKNLEEQNGILQQESASLAALNEILSGELATLKKEDEQLTQACKNWQENYFLARRELADARGARDIYYQEKLDQGQTIANLAEEVVELKKELAEAKERWLQQVEYADKYAAKLVILKKELAEKESSWSKALAAAEERYEDFKKKSDGILATTGENLQRKQEQTAALTTWKEGTEKVLDSMEEKLKDYETASKVYEETIELLTTQKGELYSQLEALKQINSFQEHRIEVLSRKARKKAKEQND